MKKRLDVLLVEQGLADSREKAKAIIMSGIVYVDNNKEDKAGTTFDETAKIEVRGNTLKYVSRGGLKLEKAMDHFGVELAGKVCMDVGASTGGFTDCMLQNGAVKVYAVDVGYGQLAWSLRTDERVVNMERTNIRNVTPDMLADLEMTLEMMELGPLLGLFLQSFLIKFTMLALNIFIFVIVYGRMIEIYLLTSLAPIPVATLSNRELGTMGQNYLRSLFAVGFQGMLILVCVAIYAVLIQGIATSGDPIGAIWGCIGYTVLLCFMLMKTGTISKSIFSAH